MRLSRILAWGVFLGASWTWCIGMFLPVLLVRDYGVWAWVVFAVPNVVGAAAMAWVIPDREASERFVGEHREACQWFSVVTLAFHAFFICALFFSYRSEVPPIALALCAVLFLLGDIAASAVAIAVSYAVAVFLWHTRQIPNLPLPVAASANLFWLAIVCLFGFSLCPYLDLTFHKARRACAPSEGRAAFCVGFGVFFLSMIVFSLCYSGGLAEVRVPHSTMATLGPTLGEIILGVHFCVQIVLKFVLHGRIAQSETGRTIHGTALLAIPAAGIVGCFTSQFGSIHVGLSSFEFGYRCFMVFYGLIFPAYAWICIFGRRGISTWLIAILLAMPMYWMGFIERQMIWLLPGVMIVVLARFVAPKISMRSALEPAQ